MKTHLCYKFSICFAIVLILAVITTSANAQPKIKNINYAIIMNGKDGPKLTAKGSITKEDFEGFFSRLYFIAGAPPFRPPANVPVTTPGAIIIFDPSGKEVMTLTIYKWLIDSKKGTHRFMLKGTWDDKNHIREPRWTLQNTNLEKLIKEFQKDMADGWEKLLKDSLPKKK